MLTTLLLAAAALQSPAPAATAPAKDKKECRSMMVTGSNLRRTKCRTRAEWAQIDAADAASVRQFRDRQSGVLTSQQ